MLPEMRIRVEKVKVAALVYPPWKQARRKDDSFDGLSNVGMYLLIHELNKAGIDIGFCYPESAHKFDLVLVSFTSPLRPSPCTPVAYAHIQPTTHLRLPKGVPIIPENDGLLWYDSRYEESDYSRFEMILVERFTHEHDRLLHFVATNKKFNSLPSSEKMFDIMTHFDTTNIFREYDVNEQLPTWFLEGYTPQDKIRKMRIQMKRKQRQISDAEA